VAGALVNNVWRLENTEDLNAFLFQYFVNFNLPQGWYLVSAPIISADWNTSQSQRWIVPFGRGVGKLLKVGKLPVNANTQVYYNVEKPSYTYVDAQKQIFDGAKTYTLNIPANPPAKDFWAVTVYDTQTRSQLQSNQKYPTVGGNTEGLKKNKDGSYTIYFGPKAPKGYENNWVETIPGKSWFVILRMYGQLKPWIDQTWRPGEVELVK
jgi:hypothetical protein